MLNRRFLRAKVMQVLYALEQSKKANYDLTLDLIEQRFTPEWHEERKTQEERNNIEQQKSETAKLFAQHFENEGQISLSPDTPEKVRKIAMEAVTHYQNLVRKEIKHFDSYLNGQVQKIYDLYLLLLQMPMELARLTLLDWEQAKQNPFRKTIIDQHYKLSHNQFINHLKLHVPLKQEAEKRKIAWLPHHEFIKDFYRKVLKKDETYLAYQNLTEPSWEDEKNIVLYIVKQLSLKHPNANAFFEELNINWSENKKVVASLLAKTLKDLEPENMADFPLSDLSKNWDDDELFFQDLYLYYTQAPKEYENLIAQKTQNWNIERLALMDKVILKMALAEMIHFYSIPVKVSINEYIELAKTYSTPKSKQFINGILDSLSQDLVQAGKVKKSGRGLIDNK